MFVPIVVIMATFIIGIFIAIFLVASLILFATPALVLMAILMTFFYWVVIFPLGLAGGIVLMVSNFTCLMATDKDACEEMRDKEITGVIFSSNTGDNAAT